MSDVEQVYQNLIDAGFSDEELEQLIEKKTCEYKGFLTKKGAVFMIAKERGIKMDMPELGSEFGNVREEDLDYDEFLIKISDITDGLTQIVVVGRILRIFEPKEFLKKDGTTGLVGNFIVSDNSGSIKVTIWGNDVKLMENHYFKKGEIVRIIGAYSKIGYHDEMEIHIGRNGKVELAPDNVDLSKLPIINSTNRFKIDKINMENELESKVTNIENITVGQKKVSIKGSVIQIFPTKSFTKKDETPGRVKNIMIRDESAAIRVVFWDDQVDLIENLELNSEILMENTYSRHNDYSDTVELTFGKFSSFRILKCCINEPDSNKFSISNLNKLNENEGYYEMITGRVLQMDEVKQIKTKDGSSTWLFSFILTDEDISMKVNIWGENAIELLKSINMDSIIELRKVYVKYSEFDNSNVINSTRKFEFNLK